MIDDNTKKRLNINDDFIKLHNYSYLKKLNSGTKVKKNNLILLNDLLNITKQNNIIIIILKNNKDEDNLIKEVIEAIKEKPNFNWYIASDSLSILDKLNNENKNYKLGIYIKNNKDWDYSLDFYIVNKEESNNEKIKNKIYNSQKVFISNVNKNEDLITLRKEIDINDKNIFLISKNINLLK